MGVQDLLKDEVSVMAFEDPFGLSDSLKDEVSVMAVEDPFGLSRTTTHDDMSKIFDFYPNKRVTDVDMNMDISKLNFVVYRLTQLREHQMWAGFRSMSYENDQFRELE
ncbi:hypothetical protein V6N13_134058 [Hibiscus sabdariffa]|uniref:Uncharacterized protein n=1 Tax=Hibiscus sabdariffa TaxID=183260 RepID=A0ABR2QZA1_9ROSI